MSHSPPVSANHLLEQSPSGGERVAAVSDALHRPEDANLLVVSYRAGPDVWFRKLRSRVGDLPPEVGFVDVGVETRTAESAAIPSDDTPSPDEPPPVSMSVSDPTDLGGVGALASEYLEAWDGNGRHTVLILDSVTAMLEDVALDRAFSFFHLLAGRVESVDGRGYYLVDPSAHDDWELTVIRELADDVVPLDAAGPA